MWVDQRNFISKLSFAKVLNALQVLASYYTSRITGKANHRGLPISISMEPTTACNLRCPECPSGLRSFTRPTGKMNLDLLNKTLGEIKNHCTYINFYFQGEPYLHPQFLDMVKAAKAHGIYSSTSTNAHFLNDEKAKETVLSGLDRLIISIDGTTQETYESYRKEGELNKVIEGAKNMVKWKRELKSATPHVIFQFLVVKPNEHQIDEVKSLAKSIGVDDVKFKTAQIYDFEHGNALIPSLDKYARYAQNQDGTWRIKNSLDNHCWRMWSGCVITWDGRIVPCCFDKDAQHSMGNLRDKTLKEIWSNNEYRKFRAAILRSRAEVDMCKNCSEGTEVFG